MSTATSVETNCEAIVRALRERLGDDLVAVALFGSRARGDSRPGSDLDLFVIARGLPEHPLRRLECLDEILYAAHAPSARFIATTPEDFATSFPAYYLDLGLDARVLYEVDGYLAERLRRIRDIMEAAGLYRVGERGNFGWRWKRQPTIGKVWVLDWEGYRELP